MQLLTELKHVTLTSPDRFVFGPPNFNYLQEIRIKTLIAFPGTEASDDNDNDEDDDGIRTLRSIDPLTTKLYIHRLTIFHGGIDIAKADTVTIQDLISRNVGDLDEDQVPVLLLNRVKIVMPSTVEPARRWSPVQVTDKPFRTTG